LLRGSPRNHAGPLSEHTAQANCPGAGAEFGHVAFAGAGLKVLGGGHGPEAVERFGLLPGGMLTAWRRGGG
jgi:hypothetical protein